MIKRAARFVPVKINTGTSEGGKLARKFGVRGIPAILFVDAEGDVKDNLIGFKPAAAFAQTLDSVAAGQVSSIRRHAERRPRDGEAQAKLGLALAIHGDLQDAEAALLKARVAGFRGPIVGRAYNNLGDHYQQQNQLDKAIDAFNRADHVGKDTAVRAYAKSRLLDRYRAAGDTSRARRVAKALISLEKAPREYVEKAREFLDG